MSDGLTNSTQSLFGRAFPDPFLTYSSSRTPRSMQEVLRWSEAAWNRNGTYRRGCQRISRFFITKLLYSDIDDEETEKWKRFHSDSRINEILATCGDDRQCYGNSFSVVFQPFHRFLKCKKCGTIRLIQHWKYELRNMKFYAAGGCPGLTRESKKCGSKDELVRIEKPSLNEKNFHVVRLSPHQITLRYNIFSNDVQYLYRIPAPVKRSIISGDEMYIHHTPWEIVRAAMEDKPFQFNPGVVFHMKNDTIAGVMNLGWGIPDVLANLNLIDRIQVLNMHDEAIALDYIIPMRLITPAVGTGQTADPAKSMNLGGQFVPNVTKFIRRRRIDPASWFVLPFPVDYKVYGGEGREMSPVELKTMAMDELLNAQGIPADLYKGTLQIQGAPMSLRLFMQTWGHLIADYTAMLNWHAQTISDALRWDKPRLEMQFPTIADDIEKKNIQMSLAAANAISKATAFEPLGIDPKREIKLKFEEQRMEMEEQKKFQDDISNQQAQGELSPSPSAMSSMGGPAGPGGPGGPPSFMTGAQSPSDIQQQAQDLAQNLISNPSLAQRRDMLAKIRKSSDTLYAMVKSKMDELRQQAASAGQQQMIGSPG